jgi:hypothetical protein
VQSGVRIRRGNVCASWRRIGFLLQGFGHNRTENIGWEIEELLS